MDAQGINFGSVRPPPRSSKQQKTRCVATAGFRAFNHQPSIDGFKLEVVLDAELVARLVGSSFAVVGHVGIQVGALAQSVTHTQRSLLRRGNVVDLQSAIRSLDGHRTHGHNGAQGHAFVLATSSGLTRCGVQANFSHAQVVAYVETGVLGAGLASDNYLDRSATTILSG